MKVSEENSQLTQLNEMFVNVLPSLPEDVENSIYYPKLKVALHPEIHNFCREKVELQQDLNILRMSIGEQLTEKEIREYLKLSSKRYVAYKIIKPLIDSGKLDYVNKKRVNAKNQKYITINK